MSLTDAGEAIAKLKAHRLAREAKIAAIMQANPRGSLDDWLPLAYDDVAPAHLARGQTLPAGAC